MNLVVRKVDVTADDIIAGQPKQCHACPVYRALRRVFPEFDSITVHEQEVVVEYKGWSRKTYLPKDAEIFIRAFDDPKRQDRLEPFSFDLGVYI